MGWKGVFFVTALLIESCGGVKLCTCFLYDFLKPRHKAGWCWDLCVKDRKTQRMKILLIVARKFQRLAGAVSFAPFPRSLPPIPPNPAAEKRGLPTYSKDTNLLAPISAAACDPGLGPTDDLAIAGPSWTAIASQVGCGVREHGHLELRALRPQLRLSDPDAV